MWPQLTAAGEVLVQQGRVFFPLLVDPEIEQELRAVGEGAGCTAPDGPAAGVVRRRGRWFVAGVELAAWVDHYPLMYPEAYRELARTFEEQYSLTADLWGVAVPPELTTIVFHLLPHFVRRGRGETRRLRDEGEVLDFLRERETIPPDYFRQAREYLHTAPLEAALARLGEAAPEPPPPEGLTPASALRAWGQGRLRCRWLAQQRARLREALEERRQGRRLQEERLATLLWLADRRSLEVGGFGFEKLKHGGYRLYKRTGPFALQDYYGRLYLFPDCRVAVTTQGRLRPVVVEPYKHPFLRRFGPGQEICVGADFPHLTFSAANAIRALEAGLHALFYSYDRRRRNGYYSLDEPPGKLRALHFDDLRIPADHPLIVSGQVEVKNQDT